MFGLLPFTMVWLIVVAVVIVIVVIVVDAIVVIVIVLILAFQKILCAGLRKRSLLISKRSRCTLSRLLLPPPSARRSINLKMRLRPIFDQSSVLNLILEKFIKKN